MSRNGAAPSLKVRKPLSSSISNPIRLPSPHIFPAHSGDPPTRSVSSALISGKVFSVLPFRSWLFSAPRVSAVRFCLSLSPDHLISGALACHPPPYTSTRILKGLRNSSPDTQFNPGLDLPVLRASASPRCAFAFPITGSPSPPLPSQIGVDFRGGHPNPSQIGADFSNLPSFGVDFSRFPQVNFVTFVVKRFLVFCTGANFSIYHLFAFESR